MIIPAYNAARSITQTLNSVLQQTYQDLEVIVVDDGSTDTTADSVRAYQHRDERIRLIQQANAGAAASRNVGIQEAQGSYIAPLDADDIWESDTLEHWVACLDQSGPEVGVVYGWSYDINEQDQPTGEFRASSVQGRVFTTLLCHNFLGNASAALVRRSCFERVGLFDTSFQAQGVQGCEDWDLYLRIAQHYEFRVVKQFLVGYRQGSTTMSGNYERMARSHQLMVVRWRQRDPSIPALLYRLSQSSFYLYLARQSDQYGAPQQTLQWLYRALQAEWLTPPFRYGLYLLWVRSVLKQHLPKWLGSWSVVDPETLFAPASQPQLKRWSVQFKLWVGSVLHQSLLRMLGH